VGGGDGEVGARAGDVDEGDKEGGDAEGGTREEGGDEGGESVAVCGVLVGEELEAGAYEGLVDRFKDAVDDVLWMDSRVSRAQSILRGRESRQLDLHSSGRVRYRVDK
jgi:hypothetical protein